MRSTVAAMLALSCIACERNATREPDRGPDAARAVPAVAGGPASDLTREQAFPLAIKDGRFVTAHGEPFAWRGITAFRLAELIAHGREQEAAAYLDWAASQQLTVVRVLLMARYLFQLTPEDGRAALPRLLDLARARGIAVEVVALADTKEIPVDYETHIREVGRVAGERGNALIEIANEPGHPTQDPRLHEPAFARSLAALLPEPLLVALGSFEYGDEYAAGDYATTHVPRGSGAWDHVLEVATRAEWVSRLKKPIVSDEPIGAGPEFDPGRRDNEPSRFAAAAALTRLVGMDPTFHYDAGLQAKVPGPQEAACLEAWRRGLSLLDDAPASGQFISGEALREIADVNGSRGSFARVSGDRAMLLLIDPEPSAKISWRNGWRELRQDSTPAVRIVAAERSARR
jgi:hypothetical protein